MLEDIKNICQKVKLASNDAANLSSDIKNQILQKVAAKIRSESKNIITANKITMVLAHFM